MSNWFSKPLIYLRKKAGVKVRASTNRKNDTVAEMEVDGEYTHRFPASSRVSKALEEMSPLQLQERLEGGSYFFVNGVLFDFRDGNYNGFIHTPESINALQDVIGIRGRADDSRRVTQDQGTAKLSKVWSEQKIQVPGMDKGGVFSSRLTFSWNPFIETIRSSFDIVRLICANGMTGLTSLFNARIPLINRWEEHLEIADKQIQNKLYSMLTERLEQMSNERATLADCLRLRDHATDRIDDSRNAAAQSKRRSILDNIRKIVSPETHVGAHYKPAAFQDRRLAAQLPSHLTMFDAYNIATEIASHTAQTGKSSNHALDKFANELIFDRTDTRHHAARFGGPVISSFSNPDKAFFGDEED